MAEVRSEGRGVARIDQDVTRSLSVSTSAGGLAFNSMGEVMEFGKLMAVSNIAVRKHLRNNPGACVAVCMQAVEWRMSPYAVANKSYLVNDQIAYESQLINAVVLQRAPIRGRIKVEYQGEGDKRTCRVWAVLRDEDDEIVEYVSPPFSKITPKNSPLWKSDPDQQLYYYSVRSLARRHFPDVILGVYSEDELPARQPPQRARPAEAPLGIASKLDRLAAKDAGPVIDQDPHNPETGEIIDNDSGQSEQNGDTQAIEEEARRALDNLDHRPDGIDMTSAPEVAAYADGIGAFHEGSGRDEIPDRFEQWGDSAAEAWRAGYDYAAAELGGE